MEALSVVPWILGIGVGVSLALTIVFAVAWAVAKVASREPPKP